MSNNCAVDSAPPDTRKTPWCPTHIRTGSACTSTIPRGTNGSSSSICPTIQRSETITSYRIGSPILIGLAAAVFSLVAVGQAGDWLSQLRRMSFADQLTAIKAVSSTAPAVQRERVAPLILLLKDRDQSIRTTAAAELAEI